MEMKNSKKGSYSDKLCKCCLRNRHILKDLWGVALVEGDTWVYGEIITKCFAIAWQKRVDCTELICESCIKRLLIAFKFKRDVLTSEQILLEQLEGKTKKFLERMADNQCNDIADEEDMADNDIIQEGLITDEDSEYKAVSGNLHYFKEPVMEDNMERQEYLKKVYLKDNINVEPVKQEKEVTASSSLLKHPSPCALCGQDTSSSSSPAQHKCTPAANTSSRDIEEQGEQTAPKFTCDICKRDFKLKSSLYRHILHIHKYGSKSKIIFTCQVCGKQFPYSAHLNMHQRIHTGEKPYSCKICNKQFAVSSSLISHERVHTGHKPYSCKICNKQFSCRSNLVTHQRTHTGDKPYSCEICNKKFSVKCHLIRHQRTHTGEKPYACKICNKHFSDSSALTKHERIHTGDKPYSCKICNKQYSDKRILSKHENTHGRGKNIDIITNL